MRGCNAPGENGISVESIRFGDGVHFSGIPQPHLVWVSLSPARGGCHSLAEISARTGFADLSHLSRWIRRVHGVSIRRLLARP